MNRLPSIVLAGTLALAAVTPALHPAPASARPLAAAETATVSPGTVRAATAETAPAGAAVRPATVHRRAVTDGVEVLSVRGAGPFRIGARLDRLSAAGLIDWSVELCGGMVHAGVTGEWAGKILLAFRHGRLVEVGTATVPPRSPAGAAVGMSFAELEEIYGPRGSMIRNDAGDASAYLVRFGNRVELYTGHPIRSGVGYYAAGRADYTERTFREGGTC